jgi:hypothetical protein
MFTFRGERARARRGLAVAGLGAVALAVGGTAAEADAAPAFTCQAGALSGTLLGHTLPISQIPEGPCQTKTSTPIALPPPLAISLLGAGTSADDTHAVAAASLANLDLGLGQIPLDLDPLVAGIKPIVVPLPPALTLLGLPSSITIDVRQAVKAALPSGALPLSLVKLGAVNSLVGATCNPDGTLTTSAQSRVADLSVLGIKIDTGKSVDQAVPLLDTTNVNAANLDLSRIVVDTPGVDLGVPALKTFLDNAIKGVLTSLPPIQIPESVARVRLALADVHKTATSAEAAGVHLTITLLNQPVLDLVVGGAKVAASGSCPGASTPVAASSIPAALRCTDRRIVLEDVLLDSGRVHLRGFTTRQNAGRHVTLRFLADGSKVASPVVRSDGSFVATVPAPAASLIGTDKARYRALIGKYESLGLKLTRRLQFTGMGLQNGKIRFAGRVERPAVGQTLEVRQRVTCTNWKVIERVKVPASGVVRLTVPKPAKGAEAVYRLQTMVRFADTGSRKLFDTFTTPRSIKLR